jgi:hypothetical protein
MAGITARKCDQRNGGPWSVCTATTKGPLCPRWVIRVGCSSALDGCKVASYPKADIAPMPRDGSLTPRDLVGKFRNIGSGARKEQRTRLKPSLGFGPLPLPCATFGMGTLNGVAEGSARVSSPRGFRLLRCDQTRRSDRWTSSEPRARKHAASASDQCHARSDAAGPRGARRTAQAAGRRCLIMRLLNTIG